jgi:hypothetical protein
MRMPNIIQEQIHHSVAMLHLRTIPVQTHGYAPLIVQVAAAQLLLVQQPLALQVATQCQLWWVSCQVCLKIQPLKLLFK